MQHKQVHLRDYFGNKDFKMREQIENKKYLAISLLDNSANVFCLSDREKPSEIKSAEAFLVKIYQFLIQ